MKKTILSLCGACLVLAAAVAVTFDTSTATLPFSNLPASSTSNANFVVDCRSASEVCLGVQFRYAPYLASSNWTDTNVLTIGYAFSLDATNYDSPSNYTTVTVTGDGTNLVFKTIPITTSGKGWLKVIPFSNASSNGMTNFLLQSSVRTPHPL